MAPGQRGDAAGDAEPLDLDDPLDDLDSLDDLDDEPRPPRARRASGVRGLGWSRWPEAFPAWARGPAAVVVMVLTAGAVGAVAGSSHRVALDQRTALEQALTVGYAFASTGEPHAGTIAGDVHLALVNHSADQLAVRLQGLSLPHQGTSEPPEEVRIDPGALVAAPLPVRVDCDGVRSDPHLRDDGLDDQDDDGSVITVDPETGLVVGAATSATSTTSTAAPSGPTVLLASVRPSAGGSAVDVQVPLLDSVAARIEQELNAACQASRTKDLQTGWLWLDDGALRVTIAAKGTGGSVRLQLDSTAGLDPTSDPPLPRELNPGETVVVDIRVRPRCVVVGDGSISRLDLQAVDSDGSTVSLGRPFSTTIPPAGTAPWLARQVALACG
ncbi:hypothetical protein SAMN06264364_11545 [Quadrisphaera granulorum]|uniref:Uncharacterized protein n=1 Tax=Quadrisphaera granulorum TaxID=317664 RepID=A0A316A730_9ACTN|nr:hypothetical protein [Quadrisphaera granulorum]PWJ53028.1 hypothetical protein BXY45_11545 [Quadrisphaera granulorum]SZE97193.1 hypothetical protein SAMN06264364_11545 [Quadrisphaera granulorum]